MIVTTKRPGPLRDRLGLVLLDLGKTGFFRCLALKSLDMLPSLSYCSPGLHESPVRIPLSRLGAQDALACRDDGWVFMAMQKPMAGGTRSRGRGVLSWGEGTTTAENAASAVLDNF